MSVSPDKPPATQMSDDAPDVDPMHDAAPPELASVRAGEDLDWSRIEAHLQAGEALIVLGDMNDGPGLDEYEHLFGHSTVEIILGETTNQDYRLFDPHARQALTRRIGATATTSRFYLSSEKRYMQALLDYVMLSPDLMARRPAWRIWHPFDDPDCWTMPELRAALIAASDHFPVTVDLDL